MLEELLFDFIMSIVGEILAAIITFIFGGIFDFVTGIEYKELFGTLCNIMLTGLVIYVVSAGIVFYLIGRLIMSGLNKLDKMLNKLLK